MLNIVRTEYQNPHATEGLKLSFKLVKNVEDEQLKKNIYSNSRKYANWLQLAEEHDRPAVMIGGGDSINDHVEEIKALQNGGASVFAMNAASKWAHEHGIKVDYQVIMDAREETSEHIDLEAKNHLIASRCDEATFKASPNPVLFHIMEWHDMEDLFPKQEGYVLVGGDTAVGICALCVAYTQGYRHLHVFGYDSSYREGKSHAYRQKMNEGTPTMEIEYGGRKFIASVAMSRQPSSFMAYTRMLKDGGCRFTVYGDGLLQTIYRDTQNLTEHEKYQRMWALEGYRTMSPGAMVVDYFMDTFRPEGKVIDFGCGTGRAALKMKERGLDVFLIDFTDNSRDEAAQSLPFLQHDLTKPVPVRATYGFCTDVMEHLPENDVVKVIKNIMASAKKVFFQISTVEDNCGQLIGQRLHLTVEPHNWWKDLFLENGYKIVWDQEQDVSSLFYIINPYHINQTGENNGS